MPKKNHMADLTGQRFGRLIALKKIRQEDAAERWAWLCRCDCGNEKLVSLHSLTRGYTTSCGCKKHESSQANAQHIADVYCKDGTHLGLIDGHAMNKNNTSGVRGVSWDNSKQTWIAKLKFQRTTVLFKRYRNREDAIAARKEAEERYFKPTLDKYQKGDANE